MNAARGNVQGRAFRRGAELLGGRDLLAEKLGIGRAELDRLIAGEQKPAMAMLLRVVEVILDETSPDGGSADSGDPPPGRSAASHCEGENFSL